MKTLNTITFFICLFFCGATIQAQNWLWQVSTGSQNQSGIDEVSDVEVDAAGNVYVVGSYEGILKIGTSDQANQGLTDIFVAKFNINGQFQWVRHIGGPNDDRGYGLAVDAQGNVYVTGYITGQATFFDIAGNDVTLTAGFGFLSNVFCAKYNPSGVLQFARFDQFPLNECAKDIVVGSNGNIYVIAWHIFSVSPFVDLDLALYRYDSEFNYINGERIFALNTREQGTGISIDNNNNIYISGYFNTQAQLESSGLIINGIESEILLGKYDASLNLQWIRTAGGGGDDFSNDVEVDAAGNVFITGQCSDGATFGPITVQANGTNDFFVAKYNSEGTVQWVRNGGSDDLDFAEGISINKDGEIFYTGSYTGTCQFSGNTIQSNGEFDAYMIKYNTFGEVLWYRGWGGINRDFAREVVVDRFDGVVVVGAYSNTVTFAQSITSGGGMDGFVAKLLDLSIRLTSVVPSPICGGTTFNLSYETNGQFSPGNVFSVQLSDANGNFANATTIGSVSALSGGIIPITIPPNAITGFGYRIRLLSSSPATVSNNNTFDIAISAAPAGVAIIPQSATNICSGNSVVLDAPAGFIAYQWSNGAQSQSIEVSQPGLYGLTVTNSNLCTAAANPVNVTTNPLPQLSFTGATSICTGGSTPLQVSGIPNCINYTWSPATGLNTINGPLVTASPSSSTTYTVICQDANNCESSLEIPVTVVAAPSVTTSGNTTICQGEQATLSASGANSYCWEPAIGLSSSTGAVVIANPPTTTIYTVKGHLGGNCSDCFDEQTIVITVNPQPNVLVSEDETICEGGEVLLVASGANTYLWDPVIGLDQPTGAVVTANPTTTTTYTVTGTDNNNCSASDQVTVIVDPAPQLNILGDMFTCMGEPVLLDASGATSYTWSPATGLNTTMGSIVEASPSTTTTYTLTGIGANNCEATLEWTIEVLSLPAQPEINAIAGGILTTAALPGFGYQWLDEDLNPIPGANTSLYEPNDLGIYYVEVTDANGCTNRSEPFILVNAREVDQLNRLSVFPNPAHQYLMLDYQLEKALPLQLRIYDQLGQIVHQAQWTAIDLQGQLQIDVSNWVDGVYLIQLANQEQQWTNRVMVSHQ
ncbi:MAG: SBBP repeat-containing protein [Bacteroidota bacterium]